MTVSKNHSVNFAENLATLFLGLINFYHPFPLLFLLRMHMLCSNQK